MKWDDLYDGSRAAAEDAVAGLLGEDAREPEAPAGAEDAVRREVSLSGEAYFAVARDTSAPFTVRTARGDVRVLGTEFNVKCYADEGVMEATLVEGQVGLSDEGAGSVVLEPGEQAVVGEGVQGIAVREVNVQHYIGWRENRLSFQGETLEDFLYNIA